MFNSEYLNRVYAEVERRDAGEPEFLQAVREVFESLELVVDKHPEWEKAGLLERFVEPERVIEFRVPWVDDEGKTRVNRGFRIQYNSAIGPYKGGLRFHPSVNLSIMKFLGFEQVLKNSLTTLPMGGGKGGSDFDPKGKSDGEVMRFCQSFMTELYRHIGQFTDVPAGDIGVGAREVGFLFGQYKRIVDRFDGGVITGKGLSFGGSLARTQATGYGLCYFSAEALHYLRNDSYEGKTVIVSGSGNVAQYCAEKATQLGGKVVAMSDSKGYVYDPKGIDLKKLFDRRRGPRFRVCRGLQEHLEGQVRHRPPLRQPERDGRGGRAGPDRQRLHGRLRGREHAADPRGHRACPEKRASLQPRQGLQRGRRRHLVATSGLEMSQNSIRMSWSFDEVDEKLHGIMRSIYKACYDASVECGKPGDLMVGANVAGFLKVAEAMMAQGVV